jgi:hypothetical protein
MKYFEVPAEQRRKRQPPLREAQPPMVYQNRQVVLPFFGRAWRRKFA